jgi:tetratricopeptide (TPR) repeat protein
MNISKVKDRLEHAWYRHVGYPVARVGCTESSKRALLVYLSVEMKWKANDPRFNWHQNYRQSRDLADLLAARGYLVDVVQYDDAHFFPSDPYDLVIAHPGVVSKRLQECPKTGFRLSLRTGRHSAFVDRVVAERYALLEKRRGQKLEWHGTGETNEVYRGYDAIACFDKILEFSPNNVRAAAAKGIALRELGENEEALRFFDRALDFNPINSFVYYNKAIALRNLGRTKEADECLKIVNFPRGAGKI